MLIMKLVIKLGFGLSHLGGHKIQILLLSLLLLLLLLLFYYYYYYHCYCYHYYYYYYYYDHHHHLYLQFVQRSKINNKKQLPGKSSIRVLP